MDKRYQVFVSSTFRDLQDERREVMQALLELKCIPAGMELFPASNDDAWTLIKRVIDDSDYYLVIVGGRYGSTDEEGISFTEREYDYAVESGKPIIGFLHADPEKIPHGMSELDPAARERLTAFRDKVERKHIRHWENAKDLGGVVSRSYVLLLESKPAEGWVRARYAADPAVLAELAELRAQAAERRADSLAAVTEARSDLAQGADAIGLIVRGTVRGQAVSRNVAELLDRAASVHRSLYVGRGDRHCRSTDARQRAI